MSTATILEEEGTTTSVNPEVRFLLLTQNIGTFDCGDGLSQEIKDATINWVSSACKFRLACAAKLARSQAPPSTPIADAAADFDVVVFHLQEIGGKKFSSEYIDFLASVVGGIWPDAGWSSGLLLHPHQCDQTFTAMGTIAFASARIRAVSSILSLHHRSFIALDDDPHSYVGRPTRLFHGRKFSDADTSRKGYLFFSLRIGTRTINFVNLHLYHDADNSVAAAQPFPSEYAVRRGEAFKEALEQILPFSHSMDPLFIFGDLNTRLDGQALWSHIQSLAVDGDKLAVGKKKVTVPQRFWDEIKRESSVPLYLKFDCEMQRLMKLAEEMPGEALQLAEMPIEFPPTYVKVESSIPVAERDFSSRILRDFKEERLPAWCDRIVFNPAGLALIAGKDPRLATGSSAATTANKTYLYNAVTLNGTDHDGVYLAF